MSVFEKVTDAAEQIGAWMQYQEEQEGFVTPFYLVAISRNGTMMYFRYDEDGTGMVQPAEIAKYVVGGGFDLPMHLMLTDAQGKCSHLGFGRKAH
jgi:hypothetical protein